MSDNQLPTPAGVVIYADGSFRQKRAGWGFHAYTYSAEPLRQGIGIKQLPTAEGYVEVPLTESVTPLTYYDAFGTVTKDPTNNTAELQALIEALRFVNELQPQRAVIRTDSEYVIKGLTQYLPKWLKSNWVKSTGESVANREYWEVLHALWVPLDATGTITLRHVKGHSGDVGNDLADLNARTGSGGSVERHRCESTPLKYHNPAVDANPLIMKTRMLFNMGSTEPVTESGSYYYIYQLGRSQNYGYKQDDTLSERHSKSDLLVGRRIGDATFSVIHLDEPDAFLEQLKALHVAAHQTDIVELVVGRLDNAYRPSTYQRIQQLGEHGLIAKKRNGTLITAHDELISKTLNPPRLAMDAVDQFAIMQRRLTECLADSTGPGVTVVEITDQLYGTEGTGKKETVKLHKHITNNTPLLELPTRFRDNDVILKLVLGVDIPNRNMLARLATSQTRVLVLIIANGPYSYTFATVFDTPMGRAIFQSPYSQFVIT